MSGKKTSLEVYNFLSQIDDHFLATKKKQLSVLSEVY